MDVDQLGKTVLDAVNAALDQAREASTPEVDKLVQVEAHGVSISMVTIERLVMKGEGA